MRNLKGHIRTLMRLADQPDYIVIHIGGNDIGNISVGYLKYLLQRFMAWLSQQVSYAMLIWSQILPKTNWKFSEKTDLMEKCRRRINNTIGRYMINRGVVISNILI